MLNNLPAQVSSFIGRDAELAEVLRLVGGSRLVTLVGTGGAGKTRLVLQVAAGLLGGAGEGVWFADLAPLGDPDLVAVTVADVLGVRQEPGRPALEALVEAVGGQSLLVLLDNCEHVIGACAKLADALLRGCPNLALLATSREPLGIGGERVYRVPSMGTPADGADAETIRARAGTGCWKPSGSTPPGSWRRWARRLAPPTAIATGLGRGGRPTTDGRRSGSLAGPARCRAEQSAGRDRPQPDPGRPRAGPAAGRLVTRLLAGPGAGNPPRTIRAPAIQRGPPQADDLRAGNETTHAAAAGKYSAGRMWLRERRGSFALTRSEARIPAMRGSPCQPVACRLPAGVAPAGADRMGQPSRRGEVTIAW